MTATASDRGAKSAARPELVIESIQQLREHEVEIVKRLTELPCGGARFLTNPLRAFGDVGVKLSAAAVEELRVIYRGMPQVGEASLAYDALTRPGAVPRMSVSLRSLFPAPRRQGAAHVD